jgi:penicillin-binding protein 1A
MVAWARTAGSAIGRTIVRAARAAPGRVAAGSARVLEASRPVASSSWDRARRDLPALVEAGQRLDRWTALALARGVRRLAARAPNAARAARRRLTGRRGRRVRRALGRGGLAGVVLVGSLSMFSGPILRLGADVFAGEVEDEGLPVLEQSSTVFGSNDEQLTDMPGGPHRVLVDLEEIPDHLQELVVAVEDDRFWEHAGWDGEGIARAAFANFAARGVEEGGSTISQQLAKRSFTDSERTVVRKAKELLYAVALEERYSKRQLLERYLNEVYLGSGAYGVAAAAREYFGVPVTELRPEQSAVLVGLIRSPGALDPRRNPEAARARRNVVLDIAADRGVLDRAEADALGAAPLELAPSPVRVTDPLLAAAVHRELLAEPALGADADARAERLATGGLRIETSIDSRFQLAAIDAVERALEHWPDLGGALAAVDPQTGAVRAIASLTPPGTEDFDLATQGRRQPGSTFKPLAAVAALEAGLDPAQRLEGDGPAEFEHAPGQRWKVENYGERDHGSVTLGEALSASVNTAFAQIAVSVGTDPIVDVADRVGVDVEAALGGPDQRGPSIALGALARGVSPLEMASAYGFLSTGGTHTEARIVTRVVAPDGTVVLDREPEPEQAVDPAITGALRSMLQDVIDDGTGRAAQLRGWEPAGKTGTSQNNADAWFVGTVPTLSVATWLGHPDAAQPVPGLTGGTAAAPIWHDFVAAALEGVDPIPFPEAPPLPDREPHALEDAEVQGDQEHDGEGDSERATAPTSATPPSPSGEVSEPSGPGRGRGRPRR